MEFVWRAESGHLRIRHKRWIYDVMRLFALEIKTLDWSNLTRYNSCFGMNTVFKWLKKHYLIRTGADAGPLQRERCV